MLLPFTKYFFITLCMFYFFRKLLGISPKKSIFVVESIVSLLINFVIQYLKPYLGLLELSSLVILSTLILKLYHKKSFKTSILTTSLSFVLSYFTIIISSYFVIPLKILFIAESFKGLLPDFITYIFIGFVQIIFVRLSFRFKRFKNGMPFLQYEALENVGFFISIIFLVCVSIYRGTSTVHTNFTLFLLQITLLISVWILFCWWSKRLKTIYLNNLKQRELESLKQEILLLQEEVEHLKQNNNDLSKLIHKDNKLIPAMEYTVTNLFHSAIFTDKTTKEQAEELLSQLKSISDERKGILTAYKNTYTPIDKTGVLSVDAMCHYMQQCSQAKGVQFHFNFSVDVKYFTEHILSVDKLTTLIADLTENAIISTMDSVIKNVLLSMEKKEAIYSLHIYDSGKLFERAPLLHLGINSFTTHPNEGGSGIGLMTTLEIIKAHKASFVLKELTDNSTYTKVVSICFDGLEQIRVTTARPEILALSKDRDDIIFSS